MAKKIIFDIDGVLADFIGGFTGKASELFPGVPKTHTTEQPSWSGFPGMTKEQISAVWDHVNGNRLFWSSLDSLVSPEDWERIAALNCYHEVYFCTARSGIDAKVQTEHWLLKHNVICPTVIISKKKGDFARAVGADYAIEDKANNASAIDWLTDGKTKSYLLDRPYNVCPKEFMGSGVIRVPSVSSFLEAIQ